MLSRDKGNCPWVLCHQCNMDYSYTFSCLILSQHALTCQIYYIHSMLPKFHPKFSQAHKLVHGETQKKHSNLGLLSVRLETNVLISGLLVNHSLKDLLNTYFVSAEGPALNKILEKGDSNSLTVHSLAIALSESLSVGCPLFQPLSIL